jgi:hypothetical protein
VRAFVVFGACGVVVTEVVSFMLVDREAVLQYSGVAVALAFMAVRWHLARGVKSEPVDSPDEDTRTPLSRWLDRTASQVSWSDSSRADWDRRVRPMLARQFELAIRQPKFRNPKSFDAAGRVHFGDELWAWVDPENISRTGTREQGPGRAVLNDIIERLERL